MKKIALISAIALSGLIFNTANAQIHIGFGIHINTPAVRVVAVAPAPVYTDYTPADDYYYLPDVDAYYSVPEQCYYYNNGDNWVTAAYLPGEYRNYDWRRVRHYEVRAPRPYLHAEVYRTRYRGNAYDWSRFNDRRYYVRDDRRDNNMRFDRRFDHGGERFDNRFQRDNRQQNWGHDQNGDNSRGGNDNRQQNWGRDQNRDNNRGGNDNRQQSWGRDQNRNDNHGRNDNSNEHFADYNSHNVARGRFRS